MQDVILSVQDLEVEFTLRGKTLHAIRGISLDICEGESLAIVGESGSGKSVFCKTFMGLLDSNGRVTRGSIRYGEKDLAAFKTEKEWLSVRGKEIAMVMQDPMTSLNPLKTVGAQICEALTLHQGMKPPSKKLLRYWRMSASLRRRAVSVSIRMSFPAVCASGWSLPSPLHATRASLSVTSQRRLWMLPFRHRY